MITTDLKSLRSIADTIKELKGADYLGNTESENMLTIRQLIESGLYAENREDLRLIKAVSQRLGLSTDDWEVVLDLARCGDSKAIFNPTFNEFSIDTVAREMERDQRINETNLILNHLSKNHPKEVRMMRDLVQLVEDYRADIEPGEPIPITEMEEDQLALLEINYSILRGSIYLLKSCLDGSDEWYEGEEEEEDSDDE